MLCRCKAQRTLSSLSVVAVPALQQNKSTSSAVEKYLPANT